MLWHDSERLCALEHRLDTADNSHQPCCAVSTVLLPC